MLELVRRYWWAFAITIGWLLAGIVIHEAGAWRERTNRYDGCELVAVLEQRTLWLCPGPRVRPPVPPTSSSSSA